MLGVHTRTVQSADPVTKILSPKTEHRTGCLWPRNFKARTGGVRLQHRTCVSSDVMHNCVDYLLKHIDLTGLLVVLKDSIS